MTLNDLDRWDQRGPIYLVSLSTCAQAIQSRVTEFINPRDGAPALTNYMEPCTYSRTVLFRPTKFSKHMHSQILLGPVHIPVLFVQTDHI